MPRLIDTLHRRKRLLIFAPGPMPGPATAPGTCEDIAPSTLAAAAGPDSTLLIVIASTNRRLDEKIDTAVGQTRGKNRNDRRAGKQRQFKWPGRQQDISVKNLRRLAALARHHAVSLDADDFIGQQRIAQAHPDSEAIIDGRFQHAEPLAKFGSRSLEQVVGITPE